MKCPRGETQIADRSAIRVKNAPEVGGPIKPRADSVRPFIAAFPDTHRREIKLLKHPVPGRLDDGIEQFRGAAGGMSLPAHTVRATNGGEIVRYIPQVSEIGDSAGLALR
jgi:hypothetical protein